MITLSLLASFNLSFMLLLMPGGIIARTYVIRFLSGGRIACGQEVAAVELEALLLQPAEHLVRADIGGDFPETGVVDVHEVECR